MNNFLQMIGTFASIFSVPLAIIIYFKTSDARQNKIRSEIIRSLSYRIGEGKTLNNLEVTAVFNSKVREYNLRKPLFTETSILEDIIADAVSNPFLTSEQKTSIIQDISSILQTYGTISVSEQNDEIKNTTPDFTHTIHSPNTNETKRKHDLKTNVFPVITILVSSILLISAYLFANDKLLKLYSNHITFPFIFGILIGIISSIIAAFATFIIELINKKRKK